MGTTLIEAEPWAPHPEAAARNTPGVGTGAYESAAQGSRSCCGGWQFRYDGIVPGHRYQIEWEGRYDALTEPLDMLVGHVFWGEIAPDCHVPGTAMIWDYVCAQVEEGTARFSAELISPEGVDTVTVRCTLRWTGQGSVRWTRPVVQDLGSHHVRPQIRVAVATGAEDAAHSERKTLEAGVQYYAELTDKACSEEGAKLVALPEICLQWQMPQHAFDKAVPVSSPQMDTFRELARRHQAVIVVGMLERDQDAVFNSAVVVDADGNIAGIYHKVHLASTEAVSGILPGDAFPVLDTAVGNVGCNICMDSSAAESARMIGLNGADFLVLPIMGDHRASRYDPGPPRFDEERWRAIQRTRAMDNQLCMVVARNRGRGSCIIDRSGEVLAYNDGTNNIVAADVQRDDPYRKWNGGCFRQVNWRQRRPHLYDAFTVPEAAALRRLRT